MVFAVFAITLVFTHRHRSYTSDDVSWQVIVKHWRPFSGQQVSLGSTDNFVDKWPFFALIEHLLPASRKLLFLESAALAVSGFAMFYASALYFLKKAGARLNYSTLLPFVWLASFGFSFAQLYLSPVWRSFEVGLSFATFALTAMLFNGAIKPRQPWRGVVIIGALVLAAGISIYSDPYYLYFTIGPIVIFTAIAFLLKLIRKYQLVIAGISVVAALLIAKLTARLAERAGLKMVATYPAQFVPYGSLAKNVAVSVQGLLLSFGADFFGRPVTPSWALIAALVNFLLLAGIVFGLIRIQRYWPNRWSLPRLWILLFAFVGPFIFVVFASSTLADISTYRYFFLGVFTSIIFLAFMIDTIKDPVMRRLLVGLLLVAILANLIVTRQGIPGYLEPGDLGGNHANGTNIALIDAVKAEHLTKGYANYWQANINTYLSKDTVHFLPVTCSGNRTAPHYWLIDNNSFEIPAASSFLLIDPDIPQPPTCPLGQIYEQFGMPARQIEVSDKTILIYNYDLVTRM